MRCAVTIDSCPRSFISAYTLTFPLARLGRERVAEAAHQDSRSALAVQNRPDARWLLPGAKHHSAPAGRTGAHRGRHFSLSAGSFRFSGPDRVFPARARMFVAWQLRRSGASWRFQCAKMCPVSGPG
jgi:hypothetical protein